MALTMVIGRVGHSWEDVLLSRMDDQPGSPRSRSAEPSSNCWSAWNSKRHTC